MFTLLDLQEVLGERIRITTNSDLTPEQLKKETEISQTVASLAKQMINNADIMLRADKLASEGKLQNSTIQSVIKK